MYLHIICWWYGIILSCLWQECSFSEKHCMDGNYMNMNNKYHSRFFHFQFLTLALNGFWFSQIILHWFTLSILGTRKRVLYTLVSFNTEFCSRRLQLYKVRTWTIRCAIINGVIWWLTHVCRLYIRIVLFDRTSALLFAFSVYYLQ